MVCDPTRTTPLSPWTITRRYPMLFMNGNAAVKNAAVLTTAMPSSIALDEPDRMMALIAKAAKKPAVIMTAPGTTALTKSGSFTANTSPTDRHASE